MIVYDATSVYAFKRDVFNKLQLAAGGAGPLATLGVASGPLQVLYDRFTRNMEDVCLYGGGVSLTRDMDNSMVDGNDLLAHENATSSWYVIVKGDPGYTSVEELEQRAERIGAAFEQVVTDLPYSWVVAGQGDYDYDNEHNIVQLRLDVQSQAMVKTGG